MLHLSIFCRCTEPGLCSTWNADLVRKEIYFYVYQLELTFNLTILQAEKNVFVVFYSGERAKSKILKICEAFGANRYPFSEDLGRQAQMITEVCIIILVNVLIDRCGKY